MALEHTAVFVTRHKSEVPVTVPEACGSTGENQPSLSDSPLSVPAGLEPTLPNQGWIRQGRQSLGPCQRTCVQGFNTGNEHQWESQPARGKEKQLSLPRMQGVLTGPWSCPHPIHGCAPGAGSGSDCGPGDSPGSWHPFSGSSACSGPHPRHHLGAGCGFGSGPAAGCSY